MHGHRSPDIAGRAVMSVVAGQEKQNGFPVVGLLAILLVAGVVTWFAFGTRQPLERSATGYDGLVQWLRGEGLEARSYDGPPAFRQADVGLRILPLFDARLQLRDLPFDTEEAQLRSGTEFDVSSFNVRTKLGRLNTLLIAPKWTRAARHSGYAHSSLLADLADINKSLRAVWIDIPPLVRRGGNYQEIPANEGRTAALYAPQLFRPDLSAGCTSVIGDANGHLLIRCTGSDFEFLAVSDPDFMNNHGLSLGDNAVLVRDFLAGEAEGHPIIVDMSPSRIALRDRVAHRRRNWSDLARFFAWPFTLLWGGVFALLAIAIWRGAVRFGPPERPFDDRIGASKDVSIRAKANLLRLAGKDAEILKAHIGNRLQLAASQLLGPAAGKRDPKTALLNFLVARKTPLEATFRAAVAGAEAPPPTAGVADLLDRLEQFETQLEKVMHEFGRTEQPG